MIIDNRQKKTYKNVIIYNNKHVIIAQNSHSFRTILLMHLHQKAQLMGSHITCLFSSQIIKKWREETIGRPTEVVVKKMRNHKGQGEGGNRARVRISTAIHDSSISKLKPASLVPQLSLHDKIATYTNIPAW
uniref:Uncharacterized protein n=1 Tax=Arundo donax TaxID=35708 RepID=A0A0A9HX42_ARUDO